MTMPIDPDRVHTEIEQILEIINAVKSQLSGVIPGEDMPAREVDAELFNLRLQRLMMLASQRLQTVAELLGDA